MVKSQHGSRLCPPTIRRRFTAVTAFAQIAAMIAAEVASALFTRAHGQTTLPQITVAAPEQKPRAKLKQYLGAKPKQHLVIAPKGSTNNASDVARHLAVESKAFDAARENILPKVGTNTYSFDRETIETLPQGTNAPVSNVLLQAPGVSQETGVSFEGPVHIRLEHGFIQNRINGILLPDGATGFTQLLDTALIRNLSLLTGALPAQYGFRTSGIVDVTTRTGLTPGGTVGIYGGSRETLTPYFQYGGSSGTTEYFVTGRYFQSSEGLENPSPTLNAIHDQTYQGKLFAYGSRLIDDDTRVSVISGSSVSRFQIPNNPEQFPCWRSSSSWRNRI